MKSRFFVDFQNNAIVGSKTTLKKASIPGSPEYKELMKLVKQHVTFVVVEKEIKKAEGKKTYVGLNKSFMLDYINTQENSEHLKKEFGQALRIGKFPLVRKWFLNTFKDFDMEAAKEAIDEATFAKIAKNAIEKPIENDDMLKAIE